MRYIAELTRTVDGRRVTFTEILFEADSDVEAIRHAEEWASPLLVLHPDETLYMEVAPVGGLGIFGKQYGSPNADPS